VKTKLQGFLAMRIMLLGIVSLYLFSYSLSSLALTPQSAKYLLKGKYPEYPTINYGTGHQTTVIKRGEYLSRIGDCLACHTDISNGGEPFAGGLPIVTPFGTFYSPNITSDKETCIGNWTFRDFVRAMHHGRRPDGKNYFPVFPYSYYTQVTEPDLRAMWKYLKKVPAVKKKNKRNTMPFPLNWRFTQYGWKILYFYPHDGRFKYNADKSAQWNRGKYLVDGLGHCGMCHTPMNLFGAPKR